MTKSIHFEGGLRLPVAAVSIRSNNVRERRDRYPVVVLDDGTMWAVDARRWTAHRRGGADPRFLSKLLAAPVGCGFAAKGTLFHRVAPGTLLDPAYVVGPPWP